MKRKCEDCEKEYNDFNHSTLCPHEWFECSPSAREHLIGQGIDPDTGEKLA